MALFTALLKYNVGMANFIFQYNVGMAKFTVLLHFSGGKPHNKLWLDTTL